MVAVNRWVLSWACVVAFLSSVKGEEGAHHTVRFHESGGPLDARVMVFSPDGKTLALATSTGKVTLIRTADGESVLEHAGDVISMAFTRDGSRLHMVSTKHRLTLDTHTGKTTTFPHEFENGFTGLSFEVRSGKLLVKSIDAGSPAELSNKIRVGDEIVGIGEGRSGGLASVLGKNAADVSGMLNGVVGTELRIESMPKGKFERQVCLLMRFSRTEAAGSYSYSKPAALESLDNLVWFIAGDWHELRDASTGEVAGRFAPETIKHVGQYALNQEKARFALLSYHVNGPGSAIEVFSVATHSREKAIPLGNVDWRAMTFDRNARHLLVGTFSTVEVIELETGKTLEPIQLVEVPKKDESKKKGDGASIITGIATLVADNVVDSDKPRHLSCLAVSSRGIVAVGDPKGGVTLWKFDDRRKLTTLKHETTEIQKVAFSPDGRWLSYFAKGVLHIMDLGDDQSFGASADSDATASPSKDDATKPEQ